MRAWGVGGVGGCPRYGRSGGGCERGLGVLACGVGVLCGVELWAVARGVRVVGWWGVGGRWGGCLAGERVLRAGGGWVSGVGGACGCIYLVF